MPIVQPVEEVYDHPLCKATMVCMRGPCQYYWTMITRLKAGGTKVFKKHSQACLDDMNMDLNEENIYACSHWWPQPLSCIPNPIRPSLRPYLVKLFEIYLKLCGYDFSWKTWKDNTFEVDDDYDKIKNLKLGAYHAGKSTSPSAVSKG